VVLLCLKYCECLLLPNGRTAARLLFGKKYGPYTISSLGGCTEVEVSRWAAFSANLLM
jgi:hypothetical protein